MLLFTFGVDFVINCYEKCKRVQETRNGEEGCVAWPYGKAERSLHKTRTPSGSLAIRKSDNPNCTSEWHYEDRINFGTVTISAFKEQQSQLEETEKRVLLKPE